ncbi:hypothetical protein [Thalassorhabdomicrobium marinisediminis]|uniref:hypothetical protein n=1 Tax=Thalassorhabdomicrobium marinisediminis TaxID=2170577 RepID=UPI0024923314|nr:hypothetical protein [Thalassorhabdomicrobium marinisediminis]
MRLAIALCLTLAACAEFPALEGRVSPAVANAPPPELVPLGPLLARADAAERGAATVPAALSGRIAALRARADRLRGPVIPPATRARMQRGIR